MKYKYNETIPKLLAGIVNTKRVVGSHYSHNLFIPRDTFFRQPEHPITHKSRV